MPTRTIVRQLLANERVNNIVEGTSFELMGDQARLVRVLAVTDPAELCELAIFFTDLQVLEPSQLQVASAAGLGPTDPDHEIYKGVAPAHSRLIIPIRNLTAAAADFRLKISVD